MAKPAAKVSIIIPAYNAAATLGALLDALARDVGARAEIIVVDDGSTDGTAAAARRFKGVKVITQANSGPGAARNRGARAARGEILVFIDADCEPALGWFDALTRPLLADETVAAAKGVYRTRQRSWAARFAQLEFEGRYRLLRRARQIAFVDSYSAAIRADAFRAVGGFDPHFPLADNEDVDLSFKLARAGYKMVFCPAAAVYHRHPATWRRYAALKLRRAYWRARVYRRFPERMIADNYTPQLLKVQVGVIAAFLPVAVAAFWWRPAAWGALALAAVFVLTAAPFLVLALRRDPPLVLVTLPALAGRAAVFAVGGGAGFLSRRRFDLLFPSLYVVADLALVLGGVHLIYWLRSAVFAGWLQPIGHPLFIYQRAALAVAALWVTVFASMGLYRTAGATTFMAEGMRAFRAVIAVAVASMAASYLVKFEYSRAILALFFVVAFPVALGARYAIRVLKDRMQRRGYYQTRVIIVGAGEVGRVVADRLAQFPGLGYRVAGFVDDRKPVGPTAAAFLGKTEDLPYLIGEHYADEVIVAKPALAPEKVLELVMRCDHTGAAFRVIYSALQSSPGNAELKSLGDIPIVDFVDPPFRPVKRLVKRLGDLVFCWATAPAWLPLLGALTLLAALATRRAPWTEVVTLGRDGFPFVRYDLPTDNAGAFGRFLKRTALYRLPWALAVLAGDMSVVGPRPYDAEAARRHTAWQRYRYRMKPGMTGLWLVMVREGAPHESEMEFDFYYIKNQTVLLDVAVILRTFTLIFSRAGGTKGA